jgi:hypothetical protein
MLSKKNTSKTKAVTDKIIKTAVIQDLMSLFEQGHFILWYTTFKNPEFNLRPRFQSQKMNQGWGCNSVVELQDFC